MGKNSFLNQIGRTFSTRIVGLLFAVPTSVFLARGLTPDLRGGFTLVFTSVAVASLFSGMGIAPANARFSASTPESRGILFGNSAIYSLAIGFIIFLLLLPTHEIFSLSIQADQLPNPYFYELKLVILPAKTRNSPSCFRSAG